MTSPELDPARLAQLEALFHAAMELPIVERQAYLERECGDDAELLRTLADMVAHAEHEATSLAQGIGRLAEEVALPRDRSGEEVGRYRLLERIRVGGMAEVYRANRSDGEFSHEVALKIVRRDRLPESMAPLFQKERELLARLRHPHICQIFDGGTTAAGEPYFVMEHLAGETFLDACRRPELSWRQALDLFLDLCSAVSHAHRQLVVHRDIKTENVLIEARAGAPGSPAPTRVVKLLDFGIAAALGPSREGEGAAREAWFSPSTAAPEVIAGETGGVAADVFSLGALLDRLAEILPARRQTELRRIASHASEHDSANRYPSVEALAQDVRRVRDGEPISLLAHRPGYVARRFLGRHAVAATAVATLVLGGALILAREIELRRSAEAAARVARAERDKAQAMRDFLLEAYQAADPARNNGQELKVHELLTQQLAALEQDHSLAPDTRVDLLGSLGRASLNLGQLSGADRAFGLALAQLDEIETAPSPRWVSFKTALAQSARRAGRLAEAEALLREAEASQSALPETDETLEVRQEIHSMTAALAQAQRRLPEAEEHIRLALEIQERRASGRRERAGLLVTLGSIRSARGELRSALESFEEALGLLRTAPDPSSPAQVDSEQASPELLGVLGWLGITHDQLGEPGPAEGYLRAAIPLAERLYPTANQRLSAVYNNLGGMYLTTGRLAEAEPLLRRALAMLEALGDSSSSHYQTRLNNLGRLALEREDFAAARKLLEASLASRLRTLGPEHPSTAQGHIMVSQVAHSEGHDAEALTHARRALDIAEQNPAAADSGLATALLLAARSQAALGQRAEASALLERAGVALAARSADNPRVVGPTAFLKGEVQRLLDRKAEALVTFRQSVEAFRRAASDGHPTCARARLWMAELEADEGNLDAARQLLLEARPILERELVPAAPTRRHLSTLAKRTGAW